MCFERLQRGLVQRLQLSKDELCVASYVPPHDHHAKCESSQIVYLLLKASAKIHFSAIRMSTPSTIDHDHLVHQGHAQAKHNRTKQSKLLPVASRRQQGQNKTREMQEVLTLSLTSMVRASSMSSSFASPGPGDGSDQNKTSSLPRSLPPRCRNERRGPLP